MTYQEAVAQFGELEEWYRDDAKNQMAWTSPVDVIGIHLFTFDDGKNVYSVFGGGKNELTDAQMEIFKKENPEMAELYLANKTK